jgi:hypothetical protein
MPMDRYRMRGGVAAALAVASSVLGGCLVEAPYCGSHQIEVHEPGAFNYCTCADNAYPAASGVGCVPCGEHEQVSGSACVCVSGFARSGASSACEEIPAGAVLLAQACGGDDDCGAPYPACIDHGDGGYCTSRDCSNDADCATGFWCDTSAAAPYCHRPPTGLGTSCTTSADCSGHEAAYCETFQAHVCLVADCATGQNRCHGNNSCCDLSLLVGSPLSLCVENDQLPGGLCPDGRAPVTP